MDRDNARALLQSTQQLRTHWSGVITSHFGYAIIINAAIWSYMLKAYVDSLSVQSVEGLTYIALAAALSAVLLGLWRLYTHSIDNHIAGLYPDFLRSEQVLDISYPLGTGGYLSRAVKRVRKIFTNGKLNQGQEVAAISYLVEKKRIGRRGHLAIDIVVLSIIIAMLVSYGFLFDKLQCSIAIGTLLAIIIGLIMAICGLFCFQRNPNDADIKKAIEEGLK